MHLPILGTAAFLTLSAFSSSFFEMVNGRG